MLYGTVRYIANLPEQKLHVAKRDSSANVNVVLATHSTLNTPTQCRTEVLAEGILMLEHQEEEIYARPPTLRNTETAVGNSVLTLQKCLRWFASSSCW